ncbi:MAG: hypothetical protein ABH869_04910 [Candidatus Omnitrophota bacterium]
MAKQQEPGDKKVEKRLENIIRKLEANQEMLYDLAREWQERTIYVIGEQKEKEETLWLEKAAGTTTKAKKRN